MVNDQPESSRISTYENPVDYLYGEPIDRVMRIQDRKTLLVTWREKEGELSFIITSSSSDGFEDGGESTIAGGLTSIKEHLEKIASFLRQVSRREYRCDSARESLLQHLVGVGEGLYKALIPDELQKIIYNWIDGSWLSISSNEQWIPWELLHDGQGFLGRRFMLFRLPRLKLNGTGLKGRREMPKSKTPSKILHVIGGNITQKQICLCEQHFKSVNSSIEVRMLREKNLSDLMQVIEDADVVHLTCHGHLHPLRLQITKNDDELIGLTIDSLKATKFRVRTGCLVFANACSSAAAESQFGEFVSFGWEFYLKGASVFIGTLGTIPTEAALTFAEAFYNTLISDKNGDVCRAYRLAKDKTDQNSPLPLFYCFYGNPLSIPTLSFY